MIKIIQIKLLENYTIECLFNNGIKKNIHCLPLIKQFSYIKGIDDLYNVEFFKKVEIGKMGEIYWKNIIKENPTDKSILRDFDISPEFIFNQNCV